MKEAKIIVNDFLVDENSTMIDAMKQLDRVAKKVLFVTKENYLVAAITDGDVRRWILKKGNLDALVKEIANFTPKYLYSHEKNKAQEFMRVNSIDALPILNEDKTINSIVLVDNSEILTQKQLGIPVIIMAGGLGTRLYPYTKILPKPLIPVGELPIVEHIINRFSQFGINQYFMVVNHKKNMIKAYFNEVIKNYDLFFVDEDIPLGTGGGLSLLKGKISTTFILSNCDILVDEDYEKILNFHRNEHNLITMICSLKNIRIPYGVVEINEKGEIEKMREKPEVSFFTNTGIYIVEPKVIEDLEINKIIGFPDIIEEYKSKGERIGIFPISENSWMDMGNLDELELMRKNLIHNIT